MKIITYNNSYYVVDEINNKIIRLGLNRLDSHIYNKWEEGSMLSGLLKGDFGNEVYPKNNKPVMISKATLYEKFRLLEDITAYDITGKVTIIRQNSEIEINNRNNVGTWISYSMPSKGGNAHVQQALVSGAEQNIEVVAI